MKKRILSPLLSLIILLTLLPGCSSAPPDELKLREDLYNSEAFLEYEEQWDLEITDLEIVKRQTIREDRLDTVYVRVTLQESSGIMQIDGECTMTYKLYDNGWSLENVEVTKKNAVPLIAPDYSLEDLTECLVRGWGYSGITDINAYDQTVDLENGVASYSLTATDVRKYLAEDLDVTLFYTFSPFLLGWESSDCIVNSSSEKWNIAGTYSYYDRFRESIQTVNIEDFNGSTFMGNDVVSLSMTSPEKFALEYVFVHDSQLNKYYNEGYKIECDGMIADII